MLRGWVWRHEVVVPLEQVEIGSMWHGRCIIVIMIIVILILIVFSMCGGVVTDRSIEKGVPSMFHIGPKPTVLSIPAVPFHLQPTSFTVLIFILLFLFLFLIPLHMSCVIGRVGAQRYKLTRNKTGGVARSSITRMGGGCECRGSVVKHCQSILLC